MGARFRLWWQRIKGPLDVIIVSAFLVGLVVLKQDVHSPQPRSVFFPWAIATA